MTNAKVIHCVWGVISPLIANLFMHDAFDTWLARECPGVQFERYCDDAVVHCASEEQDVIAGRLAQVGLELHPDKTRDRVLGEIPPGHSPGRDVPVPQSGRTGAGAPQ